MISVRLSWCQHLLKICYDVFDAIKFVQTSPEARLIAGFLLLRLLRSCNNYVIIETYQTFLQLNK
jgi:hypothetical protein